MEYFGISVVISAVFAAPMIVAGLAVAFFRRKPAIYPLECVYWLLPGILYWFLMEPLHLEQAFRGKGLGNVMADPAIIGLMTGALFLARLVVGARRPEWNKRAVWAYACSSAASAIGMFILAPPTE